MKRVVVFCGLYAEAELVPFVNLGYCVRCVDSGDPEFQMSEIDQIIAYETNVLILTNSLIVLNELNILMRRFLKGSDKITLNPDDVEAHLMLSVGSKDLFMRNENVAYIDTSFIQYWLDKQNEELALLA